MATDNVNPDKDQLAFWVIENMGDLRDLIPFNDKGEYGPISENELLKKLHEKIEARKTDTASLDFARRLATEAEIKAAGLGS